MKIKDVLIVGGGASGASAAFHLANEGKQVCILEKDENIRIKSCAGGMASSVQKLFPFDLKPAVEQVIREVDFSWCLKDHVIAELKSSSPFWIVKRESLDSLILSEAIKLGAELLQTFTVSSIDRKNDYWQVSSKEGRKVQGKVVVIADGSCSKWPSIFNLGPKSTHHASTTSVRLNDRGSLKDGSSRFEFGLIRNGFAWAFPLKNGINVGVGTFIGQQKNNSDLILEQLLPNLGFDPREGIRQQRKLRVWNGHHKLHGECILAVGDAASLCDPFLAEGLRPALMSGQQAAININDLLEGKAENLSGYSLAIRNRWGNSMAWGRRIAQVFYRFPKVGYQLGIKRPTAPQRIAQILSGEMGYEDIAKRVIKRLLTRS